jgi:hypothetical protein
MTVVSYAKVALLEDVEPGIELQNTLLTVAEEMSLEREPRLASCLRQFLNDLVEFGGEGAKDPYHHNVVQPSPIGGWIGDVGEDVVIEGISTKHEKHEVALPLVVGRRGFQNDRDHRLYVLDVDSLYMQVHGEGGIGVGAGVDGAIVIVILGDHDPLGSGELLFQVMSDGVLLLPSEGDGVFARSGLVQGLACGSHSATGASFAWCAVAAAAWAVAVASSSFLLVTVAVVVIVCCSSTERMEVLLGIVDKTVVVMGGGEP